MTPYDYQITLGTQAYNILKEHMLVYLACEERTGKTLSAIYCAELCKSELNVLVLTKKGDNRKIIKGWVDTLAQYPHRHNYYVTNYHQAKNTTGDYDLIILDEAHNYISSYPKPSAIWRNVKLLTRNVPIIYISATPNPQGYQQLYHQFALSSWNPFGRYRNFYQWFEKYGKPYTITFQGMQANQYDRTKEELIQKTVGHLFITKTRKELGFKQEPKDVIHYVDLSANTKTLYNTLLDDLVWESEDYDIVCDSESRLRTVLHQIEGGTVKIDGKGVNLDNQEKIDYIKREFGDTSDVVIMYNYQQEGVKLREHFEHAHILQATTNAEGIDLYEQEHLIIYSQDFSTGRHTQRRARQANKKRQTAINVHFLLVKKATSEQVYKQVSINKKNFVDSVFNRSKI